MYILFTDLPKFVDILKAYLKFATRKNQNSSLLQSKRTIYFFYFENVFILELVYVLIRFNHNLMKDYHTIFFLI